MTTTDTAFWFGQFPGLATSPYIYSYVNGSSFYRPGSTQTTASIGGGIWTLGTDGWQTQFDNIAQVIYYGSHSYSCSDEGTMELMFYTDGGCMGESFSMSNGRFMLNFGKGVLRDVDWRRDFESADGGYWGYDGDCFPEEVNMDLVFENALQRGASSFAQYSWLMNPHNFPWNAGYWPYGSNPENVPWTTATSGQPETTWYQTTQSSYFFTFSYNKGFAVSAGAMDVLNGLPARWVTISCTAPVYPTDAPTNPPANPTASPTVAPDASSASAVAVSGVVLAAALSFAL